VSKCVQPDCAELSNLSICNQEKNSKFRKNFFHEKRENSKVYSPQNFENLKILFFSKNSVRILSRNPEYFEQKQVLV
ncbi:hypothetical protein T01_13929, partial [Trichinella spiralis]